MRSSEDPFGTRTARRAHVSRSVVNFAAAAALAMQSACAGAVDDPDPDIQFGSLTVEWTIEASRARSKCAEHRAARIQIVVLDAASDLVRARAVSPCENFEVKLTMAEGSYRARATFVDLGDRRVSEPAEIAELTVASGGATVVTLAFTSEMMRAGTPEPLRFSPPAVEGRGRF